MSRYLRLNLMELARIFQPGIKVELLLAEGSRPETINNSGFTTYVTHWVNDRIVLYLPELKELHPNRLAQLTAGHLVTLQTGGNGGSNRFKTKITAWDATRKELTIELPAIMTSCERRRSQRIPLKATVTYQALRFHNRELSHLSQKIGVGASQDLNCYGMNMITDLFLPVGLTIVVNLTLNHQTLTTYGIVRCAKPLDTFQTCFATGIKFIDSDPQFKAAVNYAIHKSTILFKKRILV
jgi:hypothetical protein